MMLLIVVDDRVVGVLVILMVELIFKIVFLQLLGLQLAQILFVSLLGGSEHVMCLVCFFNQILILH